MYRKKYGQLVYDNSYRFSFHGSNMKLYSKNKLKIKIFRESKKILRMVLEYNRNSEGCL